MTMKTRWIVPLFAFGVASVINPGYFSGCTSTVTDDYEFGEEELVELLDEVNARSPFELDQGHRLELALVQERGEDQVDALAALRPMAAFASRAFACGSRRFMQSAAACVTTTGVPLRATFTLLRLDPGDAKTLVADRELAGELRVIGKRLNNGRIELTDAAGKTRLELESRDGRAFALAHFHTEIDGMLAVF